MLPKMSNSQTQNIKLFTSYHPCICSRNRETTCVTSPPEILRRLHNYLRLSTTHRSLEYGKNNMCRQNKYLTRNSGCRPTTRSKQNNTKSLGYKHFTPLFAVAQFPTRCLSRRSGRTPQPPSRCSGCFTCCAHSGCSCRRPPARGTRSTRPDLRTAARQFGHVPSSGPRRRTSPGSSGAA